MTGWAAWWSREEPALVEVYVNDKLFKVTEACELRAELSNKARTRKGYCGFNVCFENALPEGTVVRVKVQSDLADLENSPQSV